MQKTGRLLLVILLNLTSIFITKAQRTLLIDQVVAVIGNNPILLSDIENMHRQNQANGIYIEGDEKCKILEELLYQKLLLNQAEVDSIKITDKQVESELKQRLAGFVKQAGGVEKLEEYFNKPMAQIKEDLRESMRNQLLTQEMQRKITNDIKVSPSDVQKYYKTIPKDSLPIIDGELELAQISVKPMVTDEEKKLIKDKLLDIRNQIVKDVKDFATRAIMYSEDPGSATKGGELGFMNRGDLVPEFAAVAFNLEINQVSDIVETDFGYHIIQPIQRKGDQINVRHILLSPKVSAKSKAQARTRLDSIANIIRQGKISFEKAAILFSDDKETSKNGGLMVNPQSGNSKFMSSEIEPTINYFVKNLKIGELTDPFETQDSKGKTVYLIVTVKSKSKSHVANLNDDYDRVQEMALKDKKNEIIEKWITSKQKSSFIHIDNSFKGCPFRSKGWAN